MSHPKLKIISQNLLARGEKELSSKLDSIIKSSQRFGKTKIVVFAASPRSKKTCPGEDGKTLEIAKRAVKSLPKDVSVDFIDLSVKGDGVVVQPCKGCVSTAGGYMCHWQCTCYGPDSYNKDLPDKMYEDDIYTKLERADGFAVFAPVNWYSVPTQVKAMFDRLVCANLTLTKHQAFDILDIGKNVKKTTELSKSGEYDDWLKNHLEGKFAAFFIHGNGGADDYKNKPLPDSFDEKTEAEVGGAKAAIMPIVAQCKYSGIYVPDDLIFAKHINEGLDYAEANDVFDKKDFIFKNAEKLLGKLVSHIEKSKRESDNS